jgi:Ca2+-binding RTX toxin-like protein
MANATPRFLVHAGPPTSKPPILADAWLLTGFYGEQIVNPNTWPVKQLTYGDKWYPIGTTLGTDGKPLSAAIAPATANPQNAFVAPVSYGISDSVKFGIIDKLLPSALKYAWFLQFAPNAPEDLQRTYAPNAQSDVKFFQPFSQAFTDVASFHLGASGAVAGIPVAVLAGGGVINAMTTIYRYFSSGSWDYDGGGLFFNTERNGKSITKGISYVLTAGVTNLEATFTKQATADGIKLTGPDGSVTTVATVGQDDVIVASDLNGDGATDKRTEMYTTSGELSLQSDTEWLDAGSVTSRQFVQSNTDLSHTQTFLDHDADGQWDSIQDASVNVTTGVRTFTEWDYVGGSLSLIRKGNFSADGSGTITIDEGGDGTIEKRIIGGKQTAETVTGADSSDIIVGYGGVDTLRGGSGNDLIAGGEGGDTIEGGTGDDILVGFDDSSRDTMYGGDGADRYFVGSLDKVQDDSLDRAADFYYWSWGASFSDADGVFEYNYAWSILDIHARPIGWEDVGATAVAARAAATASLAADASADTPAIPSSIGDFIALGLATASFDEAGNLKVVNPTEGTLTGQDFNWADGGIHLDAGREALSNVGTSGNDELEGTRGADILIGGTGDDELEGKAGDDELSGEDGNDELEGGKGNDKLYGDRGDDRLHGGHGNDSLWGGSGNDKLSGGEGNDMLSGNDDDDSLRGGEGADRLLGGAGIDIETGGEGRDTFVFHFGDGADVITDFSGGRGGRMDELMSRFAGRHGEQGHDYSHDIIEVSHDLTGFAVFADVLAHASQVGRDAVIDFGNGDTLTLQHTRVANLHADSFTFV